MDTFGDPHSAHHTHPCRGSSAAAKEEGQQAERAALRDGEKRALGPAMPEVSTRWLHEPMNSLFPKVHSISVSVTHNLIGSDGCPHPPARVFLANSTLQEQTLCFVATTTSFHTPIINTLRTTSTCVCLGSKYCRVEKSG